MMTGICNLCLKKKDLSTKSHIISELLYKNVYDSNNSMMEIDFKNPKYKRKLKSGLYESGLLCKKCDNELIGGLETYSNAFFNGATNVKRNERPKLEFEYELPEVKTDVVVYKNIDYTKFKLFILSILWRASISKQDFFSEVNLGEKYNEIIREMIYTKDAKKFNDFTIPIWKLEIAQFTNTVLKPVKLKNKEYFTTYVFYISGFLLYYNIYEGKIIQEFDKLTIKENNSMQVPVLKDEVAIHFYRRVLGTLKGSDKSNVLF